MSPQKRGLPSTSSGQASLLRRPRTARTNQTWRRSGRNLVQRSWYMEQVVRRVVREELERAEKSRLAEYCQSCTGNGLEDLVRSLENTVQKLEKAVEPANNHSPHLRRANTKSMAKSDVRNLQLQLRTKLSLPIFTGKKLEGKGGDRISVVLIDANTGEVVTSDPESSIKLDVVVLEGDFKKDDGDNWTQKEFENYLVKQREGKRPLLAGNLQVTLKRGVGELGELLFTDNSSWNRSKKFRIGLMVASGYCENTRIREAKTDAFTVKEHRGESYEKHYPPSCDDEVYRLDRIAKDGKSHEKLMKVGINKVEDFLLQLFTDSDKLREILGKSIIPKRWDSLVRHAKTCKISWKLCLYYLDSMRKHGALFDAAGQLIGLIKDRVYVATHRLSAQEKEHGDTIVKKALGNKNNVMVFNGETFSPMQPGQGSASPWLGKVSLTSQICVAPGGLEASLANVDLTAEGHNVATAFTLPVQPQITIPGYDMEPSVDELLAELWRDNSNGLISLGDNGVTTVELPAQSNDINLQYAKPSQMIGLGSQMDYMVIEHGLPSRPTYASTSSFQSGSALPLSAGIHGMEDFGSLDSDDSTANQLAGIRNSPDDDTFQTSRCYDGFATGDAFAHWIKIFLVLKRFCHIRKRRARVVQLDEPLMEVQA
ncbi:calmodulin-binding protein 60 D [Eucalyptus grandis]|uniref:calmodulin-binding protein 60 D n=1 Tax=Eucalyptus grandis TaxID=71139 RepID=UPI00192E8FF9|nr:calmodulin-binding protein 60 D [Eucalyptus grandis]